MKVKDVMTTLLVTIHKDTSYHDAAKILREKNISGAPVVDDAGNLVGVLSEKDLFRVLYPFYSSFYTNPEAYTDFEEREKKIEEIKDHHIEKFMTKVVIFADPDMPVMKIGSIMLSRGINRIPVVENGKIVGIVSRHDIFKNIFEKHL